MFFFAKALHVVGFVAWFAGLFYLVRIFVYHVEALQQQEPDRGILTRQYHLMEWRVYRIICHPALVITWLFGVWMLLLHGWEWLMVNPWMLVKLGLLVLLSSYHFWCGGIIRRLEQGELAFTSFQFRLLNEVPTIFLVSIALLAVYRNTLNFLLALAGIIGFGILLVLATKAYRRARESGKAR